MIDSVLPEETHDTGAEVPPGRSVEGHAELDEDGDGYPALIDCQDQDAGIHPDADEVWYDGIDQDCDGNDVDADGDGHPAQSVGGADCDDRDASVSPAEAELCDDFDHDCDGQPRGGDACAASTDANRVWRYGITGEATDSWLLWSGGGFIGDVDVDGAEDLALDCMYCDDGGVPGYGVFASLIPGGALADGWHSRKDLQWTEVGQDANSYWGIAANPQPLGDWNGDGAPDVALLSPDVSDGYYPGEVRILAGPPSDWGEHMDSRTDVLVRWYRGDMASGLLGNGTVGDFNRDGLSDLVVSSASDDFDRVTVAWGDPKLSGSLSGDGLPALYDEADAYFGSAVAGGGDADGDGASDLLIADHGVDVVYLVSGADLPETAQESVHDVAVAVWGASNTNDCLGWLGDVDGDGHDDWFAGSRYYYDTEPGQGMIAVVSGADTAGGVLPEDTDNYLYGEEGYAYLGHECGKVDFDGDGEQELWSYHLSEHYSGTGLHLIDTPDLLSGPAATLEGGVRYFEEGDLIDLGAVLSSGDFDGDGYDDLLVAGYVSEESSKVGAYLLNGFEVPWADTFHW